VLHPIREGIADEANVITLFDLQSGRSQERERDKQGTTEGQNIAEPSEHHVVHGHLDIEIVRESIG
jgi:hypothetical protein